MQVRTVKDAAISSTLVLGSCVIDVKKALVFQNIDDYDKSFAEHMSRDVYCSRIANLSAVELFNVERAKLYASVDFLCCVDGATIAETIRPSGISDEDFIEAQKLEVGRIVDAETLLIARYGAWTWGHWLGELLPKIVVAETYFPKRFKYAVPAFYFAEEWAPFMQSILAFGIEPERLTPIETELCYEFTNLWLMSSVWSDHTFHPMAGEILRTRLAVMRPAAPVRRVALTRNDRDGRVLDNSGPILSALKTAKFDIVSIGQLPFLEQIDIFRSAEAVFSVLGSGLTGLIFGVPGVRVLSVAPQNFGDRFFYALTVDRNGSFADVRGKIVLENSQISHKASFSVELEKLHSAMAALNLN